MIPYSPFVSNCRQIWFRLMAPPHCETCSQFVADFPGLCPSCRTQLQPLPAGHCLQCAVPFLSPLETQHHCSECLARQPSFEKIYSAFLFAGTGEKLIASAKFSRRLSPLKVLVQRAYPKFLKVLQEFKPEGILPVPLSRWRLWRRGFNQSYVLAGSLLKVMPAGLRPKLLLSVRRSHQSPQARRNRRERLRALQGAFRVKKAQDVAGKRILILDDVVTTGATVEALSQTIKRAGAKSVQVFSLLRVARDRP